MRNDFDSFMAAAPTTAEPVPDGRAFAVVQPTQKNKQFAVWHPTLEAARKEAERLAAQHNQPYAVIQLVGVAKPAQRPVAWLPVSA